MGKIGEKVESHFARKKSLSRKPLLVYNGSESIGIYQKIGLICNLNMSVEGAFWPLKQKVGNISNLLGKTGC